MGKLQTPKPVKMIMSVLASDDVVVHRVKEILEERYGQIDFTSEILPFTSTDYYTPEMGGGLFRRFVTFRTLVPRESLVAVKRETNAIEEYFAVGGRRRVNIDPGYISAEHLILATTKGYTHRPYLGDGVYADLTLIYCKGEFQPLGWTYPDYASKEIRRVLGDLRKAYMREARTVEW